MPDLQALYQEEIMDHFRRPRNRGALPSANRWAEGHNPLCGDAVTLALHVEDDVIRAIRFEGCGCAVSQAASSMLTEAVEGCTVAQAHALSEAFDAMLKPGAEPDATALQLGRLAVFSGVAAFPSRVKCARLPWHTLAAALAGSDRTVTTEA